MCALSLWKGGFDLKLSGFAVNMCNGHGVGEGVVALGRVL